MEKHCFSKKLILIITAFISTIPTYSFECTVTKYKWNLIKNQIYCPLLTYDSVYFLIMQKFNTLDWH